MEFPKGWFCKGDHKTKNPWESSHLDSLLWTQCLEKDGASGLLEMVVTQRRTQRSCSVRQNQKATVAAVNFSLRTWSLSKRIHCFCSQECCTDAFSFPLFSLLEIDCSGSFGVL